MSDNITNLNLESFYGGRPGNSLQIVKAYDCIKPDEEKPWKNKYYAQRHNDHGILAFIYTSDGLIERTYTNGNSYKCWGAIPQDGLSHTIQVYSGNQEPKDDWKPGVVSNLTVNTERIPRVSMEDEFKAGDATTSIVNYGEYVIIDNEEDDFERGKIFKRGYNSTADLGGAEYVATICGPKGPEQYKGIYFLGQVSSKSDLYSGNVPIPPEEIGQETGNKDLNHEGWCMAVYNSTTNPPQYDIYCYDYYWNKAGSGKTYEDAWFCIGSIDEAALGYKYLSKQEAENTYMKKASGDLTLDSVKFLGPTTPGQSSSLNLSYNSLLYEELDTTKDGEELSFYFTPDDIENSIGKFEVKHRIAPNFFITNTHSIPGVTSGIGVDDPLVCLSQLNDYLEYDTASSIYLAKTEAASTYLKSIVAASTYLKKSDSNNFLSIFRQSGSNPVTVTDLNFPEGQGHIYLCLFKIEDNKTANKSLYCFFTSWDLIQTTSAIEKNFIIGTQSNFDTYISSEGRIQEDRIYIHFAGLNDTSFYFKFIQLI